MRSSCKIRRATSSASTRANCLPFEGRRYRLGSPEPASCAVVTKPPQAVIPVLEFWPDYGPGPLWTAGGEWAEPLALGLPATLAERLSGWNAGYEEHRLPLEGPGDQVYIAAGVRLLADVRQALVGRYRVVTTEPWWGEPPWDG